MNNRDDTSLDHIPSIIPARDEVVSRQQGRPNSRGEKSQRASGGGGGAGGGGAGLIARLFIVVALVAAAVACAWAWQLQQKLEASAPLLAQYEKRISDLEDRLSDTDEGVNQSAATMAVKIKELYAEVDKLWASAWRRNKAAIEALEKDNTAQAGQLAALGKTDKDYSAQLKTLATDVEKLRKVAADMERLVATGKANQAAMERLGDDVSRATLEMAKLAKRVQAGEEWQASVDGFRKQVNQSIIRLQESVGQLQAGPAPTKPQG